MDILEQIQTDSARNDEMRQLQEVLGGIEGYTEQPPNDGMLQQIAQQIGMLRNHILSMNNMPMRDTGVMTKLGEIDMRLSEILQEIRNPREKTVEFEVVTDSFNFPTKVIAKES